MQCEARLSRAQAHLLAGDPNACQATAEEAAAHDYPPQRAQVHLLLGMAQLRQGAKSEVRQSFTTAVEHADEQLQYALENYYALDRKALALCGLALTDQPDRLPDAIAVFWAARAITTAPGIVARTLRLLNSIAAQRYCGPAHHRTHSRPGRIQPTEVVSE